jgi:hypothetical protein
VRFDHRNHHLSQVVQFELYHRLRTLGIEVFPEYKHMNCRFDLVIHCDDELVAIIEVKRKRSPARQAKIKLAKQYQKYIQTGLPVVYCFGMRDVEKTIDAVIQILEVYANSTSLVSSPSELN